MPSVPRVTISAGMRAMAIRKPLMNPHAAPLRRATRVPMAMMPQPASVVP